MRVYIPGTIADLQRYVSGAWEPDSGYAITATLLEISAHDDQELLAEQVLDAAASASVLQLGSTRRVVIVVDYPRADVAELPDEHPAAVRVVGKVVPDAIACAFIDDEAAKADAAAAAKGDGDALGRLEEHTMLWYDTSEIAHLGDAT